MDREIDDGDRQIDEIPFEKFKKENKRVRKSEFNRMPK